MLQELLPDPTAEETGEPVSCRFGVLDYTVYRDTVVPILERARKSSTSRMAMVDLKAYLTGLKDKTRREDALAQFDRLDAAVQGSRWHRGAAGSIIEASCIDDAVRLPEFTSVFRSSFEFIYSWNDQHGETIHRFWAWMSDYTLPWASPADTWRTIITPERVAPFAEAANALTPKEYKRLLTDADRGEAFSPEDAEALSDWWGEIRRIARLSLRLEQGMLVSLRQAP